jgi:predicted phage terminase large subunit-like protein
MTMEATPSPGWTPREGLPLSLAAYRAEKARRARLKEQDKLREDADQIRERCKTLAGFVKEAWDVLEPTNPLKWSWHLDAMCEHLQAISEGRIFPRLIINVPPGSSKSMIVSVMWQAWEWGPFGKPSTRFLSSSFELDNVTRDTRKTRDLIQSEWYRTLWPEVVDSRGRLKRAGETSFENFQRGTREGVAFESIMGKRGDRVIIDDPHSLKGAESEKERKESVRLFMEGGLNRLNDQMASAIVIVMQRVHQDDLSGALLAQPQHGFIHLMLPMEFEPDRRCVTPLEVTGPDGTKKNWTDPRSYVGELMDPVRMPPAAIEPLKSVGQYMWAGQYQQRPAPRDGGMFKVDKIVTLDIPIPGGRLVRGWDLAASIEEGSAWTVGVLLRRVGPLWVVEDVKRIRGTPYDVEELIKKTAAEDGNAVLQSLPQDPGSAGKAVKWRFAEILAGRVFRVSLETGDKVTRAQPVSSQIEAGTFRIMKADWNAAYIDELRNFPSGSFKDQVDATSRAMAELLGDSTESAGAAPEVVTPGESMHAAADQDDELDELENDWQHQHEYED